LQPYFILLWINVFGIPKAITLYERIAKIATSMHYIFCWQSTKICFEFKNKIILKKIIIYTDGSCIGNPGPGGWAFLVLDLSDEKIKTSSKKIIHHSDFSFHTTNNRMEMTAILEALKFSQESFSDYLIELNSDSNLLIQTLNQGWKRKANLDLWSEIDRYRKNLHIKYFWVKAHADDKYNNLCDEYAQNASAKAAKLLKKNPQLAEDAKLVHAAVVEKNSIKKITKSSESKKSDRSSSDQTSFF
jgi:ribonuclease HI